MRETFHTPPPLEEVMDPGWAEALKPVEPELRALGDMLRAETAQGRSYLPAPQNILRAFRYPFDEVKVLILGQDPYPTARNAVGLAFSVDERSALPASLRNIYRELESDLEMRPPENGDLTGWVEQGVCLLNRVLTVTPGKPASHRGRGWEKVTGRAVEALVQRDQPLVAILWGRDAQTATPLLGDTPIIASPHPSPLSASRGFFGSKPFSTANKVLEEMGTTGVDWART